MSADHPYPSVLHSYRDRDGVVHTIAMSVDRGNRVEIVDMTDEATVLVARLDGYEEDIGEARGRACAADYLAEIHAYHAGERDLLPNPHPLGSHPTQLWVRRPGRGRAA